MNILDIAIAKKLAGGGGGSGTDNYNDLSNLPKINDTTLSGNKSSSALGLQSEINSDSKLASDLVDDTNQDNKFVTSTEKNTWNGKQNAIDADHKINADYVDDSTSTNKFVTASDKETWNAKQNAIDNSHKLSSDLVDDANHTNKFVTSTEKQTWNAKQNAIDADHKLSSSLVSFTDAEAAALASGIDSSKVGQISTNQTNILYTLNDGVKNLCPINNGSLTEAGYLNEDGADGQVLINPIPSGSYKLVWTLSSTATECGFQLILAQGNASVSANRIQTETKYISNTTGTFTADITIPSGKTVTNLVVYMNKVGSASNVMICRADLYSQDSTYVPYALPNYDLTRLEAEDRAALAEEIDAGAKNKFNLAGATITTGNASYTISGNSITVTSSGTWAAAYTPITLPAGDYVLDLDVTTRTSTTTNPKITIYTSTQLMDYAGSLDIKATGHYTLSFKSAGSTLYLAWYVNQSSTSSSTNTLTVTNMMVATKAAFGVSQKFVPYRMNYDALIDFTTAKSVTSTNFFTPNENYEIASTTKIYKQGNHIYGNIVLHRKSGYIPINNTESTGAIKSAYYPAYSLPTPAYLSNSEWSYAVLGYGFISNYAGTGDTIVKATHSDDENKYNYVTIPLNYTY